MSKCDIPSGMCKNCAHSRYNKRERQLLNIIENVCMKIEEEHPDIEVLYRLGKEEGIVGILDGNFSVLLDSSAYETIAERNKVILELSNIFIDRVNAAVSKKFGIREALMMKHTVEDIRELK